ncbi:MAG: hypothetical protein WAK95_07235 [Desulfobacterales bacterium]
MSLVYSSLCISLAILLFGITLIGARNPKPLPWARDFLVADVYVPTMVALGFFGIFGVVKSITGLPSNPISVAEVLGAAAIFIAAVGCLKFMHIKKRLAEFEAHERKAEMVNLTVLTAAGHTEEPTPPARPRTPRLAA